MVNKLEGILLGTVEMFKPLLIRFAGEQGIEVFPETFSICGPAYQSYKIFKKNDSNKILQLGVIETQQLPGNRFLVTIDPQPRHTPPEAVTREQQEMFDGFVEVLMKRLVELGFVQIPEPQKPKQPIGFSK